MDDMIPDLRMLVVDVVAARQQGRSLFFTIGPKSLQFDNNNDQLITPEVGRETSTAPGF
jgi:hypothetical protein